MAWLQFANRKSQIATRRLKDLKHLDATPDTALSLIVAADETHVDRTAVAVAASRLGAAVASAALMQTMMMMILIIIFSMDALRSRLTACPLSWPKHNHYLRECGQITFLTSVVALSACRL